MCSQDIYTCHLTCVNTDFPLNTAMRLTEIKNLSIYQQQGCQLVCTGIEHMQDIAYMGPELTLTTIIINVILISLTILVVTGLIYYILSRRK